VSISMPPPPTPARRLVLLALGAWLAASAAFAQQNFAQVAVPYYRPADAMQGLYRSWLLPRAEAFAAASSALPAPLQTLCEAAPAQAQPALAEARAAWLGALDASERLATVPSGPLIEPRSLRQTDFTPPRPELIARAIARQPQGASEMARIGTPAKGLPALEWLLWTQPVAPRSPGCAYAVAVAEDLAREAAALQRAVAEAAATEWDEARGDAAFGELINQWVGAAERLRWAHIDKPRREAATRGQRQPAYPRTASAQTAASWARQWQVLRELAVYTAPAGGEAPQPGQGLVPLETYLRGRGLNALADRWVAQVGRSGAALRSLAPGDTPRVDAAVRELAALKTLAEGELAPALEVSIGFSDADGD